MCEISSFFHPPVCFWLRNNLPAIQRCSDPRIPKHFTKMTLYRKRAELCPLSWITEHIMFYNINYNVFSTHEMLTNKYLVESDVQLTPCLRPGLILDSWELLRKQPGNGAGSLSGAWLQRCFLLQHHTGLLLAEAAAGPAPDGWCSLWMPKMRDSAVLVSFWFIWALFVSCPPLTRSMKLPSITLTSSDAGPWCKTKHRLFTTSKDPQLGEFLLWKIKLIIQILFVPPAFNRLRNSLEVSVILQLLCNWFS